MMAYFKGQPGRDISHFPFFRAAKLPDLSFRREEHNTARSLTDARQHRARVRGQGIDQPRR